MRIPSGVTDQYIYFFAADSTDYVTAETGLSSFTVYRSRNGAAAAAMTTPTINETDTSNMPGVYELLLDEDMTIGTGNDSEEMVFYITHAGMHPVTRTIELYRPKITAGNTLDVTTTGAAGIDWGNVENASTSVDLSATSINLCDTVTTNTDMVSEPPTAAANADAVWDEAQSGHVGAGTFGEIATEIASILDDTGTSGVIVATNNDKTGYSISGTLTTLDALDTQQDAQHSTTQSAISGLNDPTAATIADAVWDEAQSAHTTGGTFGEIATEIANILADTNELQSDDVPGLIAALNNLSAAQVNAEVVDALDTDTYAELGSVPAATASLTDKITWLFMLARNKGTQTSTVKTLLADDGSTTVATSTVSDDGTTFTRGEFS